MPEIVDQQAHRHSQHLRRLGIAEGLAVQACQVVAQSTIFSFHSGHRRLAHERVSVINQAGVDSVTIGDVQKTGPPLNPLPEASKRV
jgi:hypothetical protein